MIDLFLIMLFKPVFGFAERLKPESNQTTVLVVAFVFELYGMEVIL